VVQPTVKELENVCEFYTHLIRTPARLLKLAPWDLMMVLIGFASCIDFDTRFESQDTLIDMHLRYKANLEALRARAYQDGSIARRKLQIKLSVECNELNFAADFKREKRKQVWTNIKRIAREQAIELQLEDRVLHFNSFQEPGLHSVGRRLTKLVFGSRRAML
jgi:hypothetical protein